MPNDFKIVAIPSFRVVTPGAEVTYLLEELGTGTKLQDVSAKWFCINDQSVVSWTTPKIIHKVPPDGTVWENAKWSLPGHHRIVCRVTHNGKATDYVYEQWVAPISGELAKGPTLPQNQADPEATLDAYLRFADVVAAAAKKHPPRTDADKKKHEEQVEALENYTSKLALRLKSTKNFVRHHIRAEHFDATTQQRSPLRVFISKVTHDKWLIVDWTNPAVRAATGEYEGFGDSPDLGIKNALKDWDEDNRYPTGGIAYEIPQVVLREGGGVLHAVSGNFETDGSAYWDSVSAFFSWIGLGAAVVAGVATLVAPVPGSRVASAAIWTSIFSSTASAVINVGTRFDEGFSSWQANAMDVLTVAGNLFGAGAIVWSRGATILGQSGDKAVRMALYGAVGSDGAQGVLLGVEYATKLDQIESNPNLLPTERTKMMLELLRSAMVDGVLIYVSVRGTKADLDNLDPAALKKLSNGQAEIDATKNPVVRGEENGQPHTTKVQIEQEMEPPQVLGPAKKRPPRRENPRKGPQGTADLNQLYREAEVAQKSLNELTRDLAKKFNGEPLIPSALKGRPRAQEKIDADYQGDASQIVDLARSSVVFKTMKELEQATAALKKQAVVTREKDRFVQPMDGYRDRLYNLKMPNGHVVEIQLHLEAIIKVKDGPGHALYEKIRGIQATANKGGRKLNQAEAAEVSRLKAEMKRLYDEALESAQ